jgi:hypothetical protein
VDQAEVYYASECSRRHYTYEVQKDSSRMPIVTAHSRFCRGRWHTNEEDVYRLRGMVGMSANATAFDSQSLSLLPSISGTTYLDTSPGPTNGFYYVPTDANGNFSITGDYLCTPDSQVYLYASGGNPGMAPGTNNTAIGLIAVLGDCPSTGTFAAVIPPHHQ